VSYVLIGVGVVAALIIAFIWWRYTSVGRGARQVDEIVEKELEPLERVLVFKERPVTGEEVAALARKPQLRPMLYGLLKHYERLDLFPREYTTQEAQAAGQLAYWMMHPNELEDAPKEMELVESITRQVKGIEVRFFVFRYRMAEGHWAAKDGWLLGVAGPYPEDEVPYSGLAGAFSRCADKYGEVKPSELVDWFIGMFGPK
jgi:hypothetical protein